MVSSQLTGDIEVQSECVGTVTATGRMVGQGN